MRSLESWLITIAWVVVALNPAQGGDPKPFPGTPTKWQGFARHDFKVGDLDATVVVPEKPLPGRPWVWRGEFFGAFADADVALVKAGWHLAYLKVPDLFGSPKAVKKWETFHAAMVKDYGLHPKPGLIGLSRGGLYCMNWAAAHPDRTLAVYLDNAVCDFKSWPGGKPQKLGTGKGSEAEWKKLLAAYDFKTRRGGGRVQAQPGGQPGPAGEGEDPAAARVRRQGHGGAARRRTRRSSTTATRRSAGRSSGS